MKKKQNRGFTLIELLVVVAIIGVLATIVLASLSQARIRAKDAAVVSSMSSYRTEAELDYPTGNYTGLCTSSNYDDIETYVQSQGGTISDCNATVDDYRVIASLPSSFASTTPKTAYAVGEDGFCVNSFGTAQKVTLASVNQLAAPACNTQEASAGGVTPSYASRCNDYSPEWTGCYDTANNVYVAESLCDGLPPISCR